MNYPGVTPGDEDLMEKIAITEEKRVEGHAPGVSGKDLAGYISAGITSDHESTTIEEAREKLRLGMHVMMREGSAARNLKDLLPLVNDSNKHRFMLVTDDHNPSDILSTGAYRRRRAQGDQAWDEADDRHSTGDNQSRRSISG